MTSKSQNHIPLEQQAREQSHLIRRVWNSGAFILLLQRTASYYHRKGVMQRRDCVTKSSGRHFAILEDQILQALYREASRRYLNHSRQRNEFCGFNSTLYEKSFYKSIHQILDSISGTKHIEVYPSSSRSKMVPTNHKAVIGVHVPDFLLFGLKHRGFSSIVIEIDGESHSNKYMKDKLYYDHLESLGTYVWSIPNEKVSDYKFIYEGLKAFFRKRSGSLDKQVLHNKRLIWCKTIANHMDLSEIEEFVFASFGIQLNLEAEAKELIRLKTCPRTLRVELKEIIG